jgi:hypothetical protein
MQKKARVPVLQCKLRYVAENIFGPAAARPQERDYDSVTASLPTAAGARMWGRTDLLPKFA